MGDNSGGRRRSRAKARPFAVIAGVAGSLFFSFVAVRDVDFELFVDVLAENSYWWILPSLMALGTGVAIRVLRWRYLFSSSTRPPVAAATRAILIGEFFSIVLPFRAGEVARIVSLHREAGTSRAEAAGTVLVERLLDLLVLLLMLFAVLPFVPDITWRGVAATLLALVGAGVVAAIIVLWRYGSRAFRLLLRPLGWLPGFSPQRVAASAESLVQGLQGLRDVRVGSIAVALTLASWLAVACSFQIAFWGLDLGLGFDAALVVTVATTLALVLPSLPAALGVYEAAMVVSLGPFGIEDSEALSCAVVLHGAGLAAFIVVGLVAVRSHPAVSRWGRRHAISGGPRAR